ncbi:dolichol-P-glucose synthetase [Terrihabitans soli]|uniref:Dolichol-P-glucose synthetase n=2 Tax=Terrihabitans soli TaxID=708113 RepID=A0A6S6QM33_9HYPH|nr:dolichol-P-glucose synthetase [Terrihabitans soli]
MPCLNETLSLGHCIAVAQEALRILKDRHGLSGEVVIADNGSTDGSQNLARKLGARVVDVPSPGYGAALRGGFAGAHGRFLVMGDSDGSYDFNDAVPMIEALMGGADICMGSRFKGGIAAGAMPWKNRYIGNPVLTGILNILFRAKIDDAHCGLRALTRDAFERLRLTGSGMEFASEMVIKASLLDLRFAEVPVTLSPDLRDRAPHLRPWRDGWRHLRYLFMLSPIWSFIVPAALIGPIALTILAFSGAEWIGLTSPGGFFGNYWTIIAGAGLTLAHLSVLMGLTSQFYGVQSGYRVPGRNTSVLAPYLSLEAMLIGGGLMVLTGIAILAAITAYWSALGFHAISSVFPAVAGTCLITIGVQNMLGGFLLAVVCGNDAELLKHAPAAQDASSDADRSKSGRARAA